MTKPQTDADKTAKLAEKVRGLLAKTVENGATIEETESAALKAAELIEKYALDRRAIEAGASDEIIYAALAWKEAPVSESDMGIWGSSLLTMIARASMARGITQHRPKDKERRKAQKRPMYSIVAREGVVEPLDYLFCVLANKISHARSIEYRRTHTKAEVKALTGIYASTVAFGKGVLFALQQRFDERTAQRNANTQALVVVVDQELDAALKAAFPSSYEQPGAKRSLRDEAALAAGVAFGQSVPLQEGLAQNTETGEAILLLAQ